MINLLVNESIIDYTILFHFKLHTLFFKKIERRHPILDEYV